MITPEAKKVIHTRTLFLQRQKVLEALRNSEADLTVHGIADETKLWINVVRLHVKVLMDQNKIRPHSHIHGMVTFNELTEQEKQQGWYEIKVKIDYPRNDPYEDQAQTTP